MAFETPTTGAIATCKDARFEDPTMNPHPDFVALTCDIVFNGTASGGQDVFTYPRGSTMAVKNSACRALVNRILQGQIPGSATLSAAVIEISGIPT